MALPEPLAATIAITKLLEELNIHYFIGGSLASTVHGEVRTTQDADIIADIDPPQVDAFISSVEKNFFADDLAIKKAVEKRASFNLLHRESFFRVDVFVPERTPFNTSQLKRATSKVIVPDPETEAFVATSEDTILAKLIWFREGGGSSERQWQDVLGIIRIQGERLDRDYLISWAGKLGLQELIEQALSE